jgi:hypothetical protein
MKPLSRTLLWLFTACSLLLFGALLTQAQLPGRLQTWAHPLIFLVLACLLDLIVFPLTSGRSVSAGSSIILAALLLLGPALGAVLAFCASLLAELFRRGLRRLDFPLWKASLRLVGALAAGVLFLRLGGEPGRLRLPAQAPALLSAAAFFLLFESLCAAALIAWEHRASFLAVLRRGARELLGAEASLAGVGLLFAIVYQSRQQLIGEGGNWGSIAFVSTVVLIPSLLLYYASKLQRDLERVYEHTLLTLGRLVEAKLKARTALAGASPSDSQAKGLASLAAELGREVGLSPREVEHLRYAAYLRDLGKIGLPGHLLREGRLPFQAEPAEFRRHPLLAEQILAPISFLSPVAAIIGQQQERFDGLGFPRGLRGYQVCVGARLLAVAIAYHSLTTPGEGEPLLLPPQALARIQAAAGTRYDPAVVAALARLLGGREGPFLTPLPAVRRAF